MGAHFKQQISTADILKGPRLRVLAESKRVVT
jgi:hypothetical protein